MLAIAGKTAEPNWLTFFYGTLEYPGGRVSNRNSVVRNCAIIANKKAVKYSQNCAELRATELLFHLKINNFNCDLQIYAADTRMEIMEIPL